MVDEGLRLRAGAGEDDARGEAADVPAAESGSSFGGDVLATRDGDLRWLLRIPCRWGGDVMSAASVLASVLALLAVASLCSDDGVAAHV